MDFLTFCYLNWISGIGFCYLNWISGSESGQHNIHCNFPSCNEQYEGKLQCYVEPEMCRVCLGNVTTFQVYNRFANFKI